MKYIFSILFLLISFALQAQVEGIVQDDMGEPVPGANVFWLGTTNGVTTSGDGSFSIVKPANSN